MSTSLAPTSHRTTSIIHHIGQEKGQTWTKASDVRLQRVRCRRPVDTLPTLDVRDFGSQGKDKKREKVVEVG